MQIYEEPEKTIVNWQWQEPGLRNITDVVLDLVALKDGAVLDAGCGTGRVAISLAKKGFQVDAIDINPKVVNIAKSIAAKQNVSCQFVVGDLTQADLLTKDKYDLAICSEVLEHIENYQLVIENIRESLHANGQLILTTPFGPRQYSIVDVEAGHIRRFTLSELTQALRNFKIIDYFTTGFPTYRFIRWFYPFLLRCIGRRYSRSQLWSTSATSLVAQLVYGLTKFDNLFNRLNLGDCIFIQAQKKNQTVSAPRVDSINPDVS